MNNIELRHVIPVVFIGRDDLHSDIWKQSVTFEKGKSYLIEAASGTGKSSLCSFIFGYLSDQKLFYLDNPYDIQK